MTKKLAVIGNGTAGALSAAHFHRWSDWEIDWYYDPNIPTAAVGEGATLSLPNFLYECFGFNHFDLSKINGSLKLGAFKSGWGNGHDFFHSFQGSVAGYHFNAKALQKYIFDKLSQSPRVKIKQKNVSAETVDADFVMDCTGTPKNFDNYYVSEYIPINSVYVTQCFWDRPTFQYSLILAKKYGWAFGIPLENRCAIGYLYNSEINSLNEIKTDVEHVFEEYNLTPSNTTAAFEYKNYYAKENFTERIAKNGNASFFLEPLEATSICGMLEVCYFAHKLWTGHPDIPTKEHANYGFLRFVRESENMIMFHYFFGSKFKTEFWKYAQERGRKNMLTAFEDNRFQEVIRLAPQYVHGCGTTGNYGTWPISSWRMHLDEYVPDWRNKFKPEFLV